MGEAPKTRKTHWAVRALIVLALLLVIATVGRYIMLLMDVQRGERLYQQGKYDEAIARLDPIRGQLLASFGLRERVDRTIGMSKAEKATIIARDEPTIAGYDKALVLLEEAQLLAGPDPKIQDRIAEYTGYRAKLLGNERRGGPAEAPKPLPETGAQ